MITINKFHLAMLVIATALITAVSVHLMDTATLDEHIVIQNVNSGPAALPGWRLRGITTKEVADIAQYVILGNDTTSCWPATNTIGQGSRVVYKTDSNGGARLVTDINDGTLDLSDPNRPIMVKFLAENSLFSYPHYGAPIPVKPIAGINGVVYSPDCWYYEDGRVVPTLWIAMAHGFMCRNLQNLVHADTGQPLVEFSRVDRPLNCEGW